MDKISTKNAPANQRVKPDIRYSGQLTIQAYEDAGFPIEYDEEWPLELVQCREFLNEVDLTKGPKKIERTLSRMGRLRAYQRDPKTGKRVLVEWLIYYENWGIEPDNMCVNYLEEPVAPVTDNLEGVHKEPVTKPEYSYDDIGRKTRIGHSLAGKSLVYEIPFSKKAVEEILERYGIDKGILEMHGDDRENPAGIKFYFYHGDGSTTTHNLRTSGYSYKQFTECTYNEMYQLSIRPGGPTAKFEIPANMKDARRM
jgi:hypothetical protein